MKEFVNCKEASEILGISQNTMRKIRNAEGFEFTRLGRQIVISKEFLLKYVREHRKIKY